MQLNEVVAKPIAALCKERGMTQYRLFQINGVARSTLSTIMSCAYPSMKLRVIYEICEGLEISLEEFFHANAFSREQMEY